MSCGRYITHLIEYDTGACRECGAVDPIHLSWKLRLEANAAEAMKHPEIAAVMRVAADYIAPAQAGEAGTAETVKQGSVHEHAVAKPCAQDK